MKPVLLLVAGMLNDGEVWQDVASALSAQADVHVALPVQACVPAMAQAAWDGLADVAPHTPIVLAGFSLGGYVAIEMLARPVRPLRAAVLIATSAQTETPAASAQRDKTIAAMQHNFAKLTQGLAPWNTHQANDALVARLRAMMLRVGADCAVRQLRAIAARHDHRDALARLALPVTVLCGAEDRVIPPAHAQDLAALIPSAKLHRVEAAGHMLPLEAPQAIVQALSPWLH
jgi:pimeloyl-ACP methyl ester carboxylesterase